MNMAQDGPLISKIDPGVCVNMSITLTQLLYTFLKSIYDDSPELLRLCQDVIQMPDLGGIAISWTTAEIRDICKLYGYNNAVDNINMYLMFAIVKSISVKETDSSNSSCNWKGGPFYVNPGKGLMHRGMSSLCISADIKGDDVFVDDNKKLLMITIQGESTGKVYSYQYYRNADVSLGDY